VPVIIGIDPRTLAEKDYDDMFGPDWGEALWHWSRKKGWTRHERRKTDPGREAQPTSPAARA
jgi:hypothetical protein